MKLKDRVALVTGAGSPIGKVITRHLLNEGAKVVLGEMDDAALASAFSEFGDDIPHVRGDFSDEAVVDRFVAHAIEHHGRIEILVNNAGGGIVRPFLEHTPETLRETINRNLLTTLWCCLRVLPVMVARGYGRIVNIGADSVRNGLWNHAGYNAAKGGVHGLTTGLAREFASHDITINTVAPCMVATPRAINGLKENPALFGPYLSVIPKGRPAGLEEVASMVAYLATDEAAFVTGQVISVNGGSTML